VYPCAFDKLNEVFKCVFAIWYDFNSLSDSELRYACSFNVVSVVSVLSAVIFCGEGFDFFNKYFSIIFDNYLNLSNINHFYCMVCCIVDGGAIMNV